MTVRDRRRSCAWSRLIYRWPVQAAAVLALVLLTGCEPPAPATPAVVQPPPIDVPLTQAKAEQNDRDAQKLLGDAYAAGRGVQQDYKQAAAWYRKAAEQGDAAAQNSLGELIEAGQGAAASDEDAAGWYRKAAEQGHAAAQYNLAVLHAFGRGTPVNEAEAVKWYRKAAEQGHALAQFNIGQRYQLGKGVAKDLVEAYIWLSLAAESIVDSVKLRDEAKSEMTRAQLAEARRRIEAFKARRKGGAG